jgi:hypothetical protein
MDTAMNQRKKTKTEHRLRSRPGHGRLGCAEDVLKSGEVMRFRRKRTALSREISNARKYLESLLEAEREYGQWEVDLFERLNKISSSGPSLILLPKVESGRPVCPAMFVKIRAIPVENEKNSNG